MQNMFLSAFLIVLDRWWYYYYDYCYYYYSYLEEDNYIIKNDEFQYLAKKGFVSLFFSPRKYGFISGNFPI